MTHTLEREHVENTEERPVAGPVTEARPDEVQPPADGSGRGLRAWRNRAVALVMVAGAGFGTYQLIGHQASVSDHLAVDDVVLTTQPIDVTLPQTGLVTAVAVRAGDRVTAGQRVGSVAVTTTNSQGRAVVVAQDLQAPSDGVVVTDPLAVGNTLLPGANFLEMYDPSKLQLVTTVPLSVLPQVSAGMTADLTAPGVPGTVRASLARAVPRVGTDQTTVPKGDVQLVLTPRDPATVATLLPGLRFGGYVDTGSAHGTRALFVGSAK